MKYNKDLHGLMKLLAMVDNAAILSVKLDDKYREYVLAFTYNFEGSNVFHVINGKYNGSQYMQDRLFILDNLMNTFASEDSNVYNAAAQAKLVYEQTRFNNLSFNEALLNVKDEYKSFVTMFMDTNDRTPVHGYAEAYNSLVQLIEMDKSMGINVENDINSRNIYQSFSLVHTDNEFIPVDEYVDTYPTNVEFISENYSNIM